MTKIKKNTNLDKLLLEKLFLDLKKQLEYDPEHEMKKDKTLNTIHLVRNSLLYYLINDFPYGKDWVHPITYESYKCSCIKTALLILKELNPERYKILWALWATRKTVSSLSNRFYCSVQTIKRQWERAIDSLILLLFFPELNVDITNVTKIL